MGARRGVVGNERCTLSRGWPSATRLRGGLTCLGGGPVKAKKARGDEGTCSGCAPFAGCGVVGELASASFGRMLASCTISSGRSTSICQLNRRSSDGGARCCGVIGFEPPEAAAEQRRGDCCIVLALRLLFGRCGVAGACDAAALGEARELVRVLQAEGMIGGVGDALQDFSEAGRVHAFGEIWQARSDEPIAQGDKVQVVAVDGLTLIVKPED